jgi:hypothetical protein
MQAAQQGSHGPTLRPTHVKESKSAAHAVCINQLQKSAVPSKTMFAAAIGVCVFERTGAAGSILAETAMWATCRCLAWPDIQRSPGSTIVHH